MYKIRLVFAYWEFKDSLVGVKWVRSYEGVKSQARSPRTVLPSFGFVAGICKKILQSVFLSQLNTRFCSDLCLPRVSFILAKILPAYSGSHTPPTKMIQVAKRRYNTQLQIVLGLVPFVHVSVILECQHQQGVEKLFVLLFPGLWREIS